MGMPSLTTMKWVLGYLSIIFFIKDFVPLDATAPIRLVRDTFSVANTPSWGVAGIIQVYHSRQWGTVCYGGFDDFDMRDAKVACRQLGFSKAVGYWWYGRGTGKVWLYNMRCRGSEASLESCTHGGWGSVFSGCKAHTNDVGVVCSGRTGSAANNIRFEPGTEIQNATAGIVQVQYQNLWGTVCDGSWDLTDAKVACRQLGFTKTVGPSFSGRGKGEDVSPT